MAMGNSSADPPRLNEVRAALTRIDLNTFGFVSDCEEEIGSNRLAAVPLDHLLPDLPRSCGA